MINIPLFEDEIDYYSIVIPNRIDNEEIQIRYKQIMNYLTRTAEYLSERLFNDRNQLTIEDRQYIKKMIKSFKWKATRIFGKLWDYQNR